MEQKETVNKDKKALRRLQLGICVEACTVLALQVFRAFLINLIAEAAAIAITLVAWLMIFSAMTMLQGRHKEYKKAWIASILGFVFILLQGASLGRAFMLGMAEDSYVDMYVVFFSFAATLMMLYILKKCYNIGGPRGELSKPWILVVILILGSLFAVPVMMMFPKIITWVGTLLFALLGACGKFYASSLLLNKKDGLPPVEKYEALMEREKARLAAMKKQKEREKAAKAAKAAEKEKAVAKAEKKLPEAEEKKAIPKEAAPEKAAPQKAAPRKAAVEKEEKAAAAAPKHAAKHARPHTSTDTQIYRKEAEADAPAEEPIVMGPRSRRNASRRAAHSRKIGKKNE